jgi:hypothetical protein
VRAQSMAVLPPPTTTTRRPMSGRSPRLTAFRNSSPARTPGPSSPAAPSGFPVRTRAQEDRGILRQQGATRVALDPRVAPELDAQPAEPLDLPVQHFARGRR